MYYNKSRAVLLYQFPITSRFPEFRSSVRELRWREWLSLVSAVSGLCSVSAHTLQEPLTALATAQHSIIHYIHISYSNLLSFRFVTIKLATENRISISKYYFIYLKCKKKTIWFLSVHNCWVKTEIWNTGRFFLWTWFISNICMVNLGEK